MKLALILCLLLAAQLANCGCSPNECIGYDKEVATYAAKYATCSNLLTQFSGKIGNWSYVPCLDAQSPENVQNIKVITDSEKYLLAFTAYDKQRNVIVASFRGTVCGNGNSNVQLDANISPKNYVNDQIGGNCIFTRLTLKTDCNAHKGFYNGYEAIKDEVRSNINTLLDSYASKSPNVLVTGISLGGALAAFATFDLVTYFKFIKKQVTILPYTFGQPRIGNQRFIKQIDDAITIFRVVHKSDPVPHMPPRKLGTFNYFSPGIEIYYESDKDSLPDICAGDGATCSLNKHTSHTLCDHLAYPNITFAGTENCQGKVCSSNYDIDDEAKKSEKDRIMDFMTSYCQMICANELPDCLKDYPEQLQCDPSKGRSNLFQELVAVISPKLLLNNIKDQKKGVSICNMGICDKKNVQEWLASADLNPAQDQQL